MAEWHISRINNHTHEVELKSHLGDKINTVVPEEHRDSHEKHGLYLKSIIAEFEKPKVEVVEIVDETEGNMILRQIRKHYQIVIILALLVYILQLKACR